MTDWQEAERMAENSPFLQAREEVGRNYRDVLSSARPWRFIALLAIASNIALGMTNYFLSKTERQVVPYVVYLDENARTHGIPTTAEKVLPNDERLIRERIADVIRNVRSYVNDRRALATMISRAKDTLRGDALKFVADWFHDFRESSNTRQAPYQTEVRVISVVKIDGNSWEVEWIETTRSQGQVTKKEDYQTVVKVLSSPPGPYDEQEALTNPLGIYITEINGWSLKQRG